MPRHLFVWDDDLADPVLKLFVRDVVFSRLAFDEPGTVLLLLCDNEAVQALTMDPDAWIRRGRALRQLDWTRETSRPVG